MALLPHQTFWVPGIWCSGDPLGIQATGTCSGTPEEGPGTAAASGVPGFRWGAWEQTSKLRKLSMGFWDYIFLSKPISCSFFSVHLSPFSSVFFLRLGFSLRSCSCHFDQRPSGSLCHHVQIYRTVVFFLSSTSSVRCSFGIEFSLRRISSTNAMVVQAALVLQTVLTYSGWCGFRQWESTGWIGQGAEEKGEAGKEAEKNKEKQFQSLAEEFILNFAPAACFRCHFVFAAEATWWFSSGKHGFWVGETHNPTLQSPTPRGSSSSDSSSSESSGGANLWAERLSLQQSLFCDSVCEEKKRKRKPRRWRRKAKPRRARKHLGHWKFCNTRRRDGHQRIPCSRCFCTKWETPKKKWWDRSKDIKRHHLKIFQVFWNVTQCNHNVTIM